MKLMISVLICISISIPASISYADRGPALLQFNGGSSRAYDFGLSKYLSRLESMKIVESGIRVQGLSDSARNPIKSYTDGNSSSCLDADSHAGLSQFDPQQYDLDYVGSGDDYIWLYVAGFVLAAFILAPVVGAY